MIHYDKEAHMNCKVVELKPAKVIGMVYQGKGEGGEIPAMWQVFNVRYKEVKNPDLFKFYGLCYGYQDDGAFSYMSGVGIIAGDDKVAEIPSGMSLQEIPGGKYAVFTFKDDISKIGLFWNDIYQKGIPENQLKPLNGMTFELYDERFEENGTVDIYIPIA